MLSEGEINAINSAESSGSGDFVRTQQIFSIDGEPYIGIVLSKQQTAPSEEAQTSILDPNYVYVQYPAKITWEIVEKTENNTTAYYAKSTLIPLFFGVHCVNDKKGYNIFKFHKTKFVDSALSDDMVTDEIVNKWKALTGQQ